MSAIALLSWRQQRFVVPHSEASPSALTRISSSAPPLRSHVSLLLLVPVILTGYAAHRTPTYQVVVGPLLFELVVPKGRRRVTKRGENRREADHRWTLQHLAATHLEIVRGSARGGGSPEGFAAHRDLFARDAELARPQRVGTAGLEWRVDLRLGLAAVIAGEFQC
jgi:hypothetical protein